jgi:hypothetical protein
LEEEKAAQRRAENVYFIRAVQRVEALSCVIDGAMKKTRYATWFSWSIGKNLYVKMVPHTYSL